MALLWSTSQMRFKSFLAESPRVANVSAEDVLKDCAYYFKMVKLSGNELKDWMWHGTKAVPSNRQAAYIVDAKQNREPRDTPISVHNMVNDYFKQAFGKPFRNGVFATGYYSDATIYSRDHSALALVPIGTFWWLCAADTSGEFRDLTGLWKRVLEKTHDELSDEHPNLTPYDLDYEAGEQAKVALLDEIQMTEWYFNEYLMSCIHSENEIMIMCDKFYLIDRHSQIFKDIYELVGKQ